jgi:tolA protein
MKQSLYKSLALHFVVFLLVMVDIPLFWHNKTTLNQVPIIVDLNNVKISEMTNLPPKAKMGKEDKAASKVKRKIENNYTKEEPKKDDKRPTAKEPEEETAPEEAAPTEPKKDYLVAPQPKKPKAPKKKPTPPVPAAKPKPKPKPKPEVKKEQKQPEKGKPQLANPLKSLLASVDALEKEVGNTNQEATIKEGTEVNNMGIEGGTGGSYFSELSISEIDAIAGRLRACWNLDPGAMGIKDMIIEIRAFLNKDGSVRKVDIINTSRYNSDAHFRSVADSARRAVYICAPYSIFADKYADKYDKWNTMLLRFNPLDGQIR